MRTALSDYGRLATGALVGAIAAALFARGVIGPPSPPVTGTANITPNDARAPEPVPANPDHSSVGVTATQTTVPTTVSTPKSTTATTKSKRPSSSRPTTAPTGTTAPTTTTNPDPTTTTPPPDTTTTTTETCRILC